MKRTNKTFNWFTRLVLHTFVCYALALFQIIPQGITSVRADSVLTDAADTTSAAETGTNSTGGGSGGGLTEATTDEGGNQVVEVDGNQIKATGKFLFANIGLVAIGLGAPSLIKDCHNKWSVRVFGASAALYILNEIGVFTRFNSAINKEMKAYLGRGDEDRQIESLETAAKQTRKAKEAAERRALIAKVAATGFLLASGLAIMEKMSKFGMDEPCVGDPSASAVTNNSPAFYNNYQLNDFNEVDPLLSTNENFVVQNTVYLSEIAVRRSLLISKHSVKAPRLVGKILEVFIAKAYAQEAVGTDKDAKIVKGKDGKETIVVNSVGAKLAAIGLGVAGGMAAMKVGKTFVEPIKKKMVYSATGRAVGFGVFGATAYGAATESADAAKKLENRAQEYDRLADSLRNRVDQQIDMETGTTSQFIDQTVQNVDGSSGDGIGNNSLCATGGASTGLKPDTNCSCAKTNSCASPQIPDTTGLPAFAGSALLADSIGSLNGSASNLFSGRLKEAKTKGQALTNNAARITKLRSALQKKFNEDRLKDGKKAVDFEKAEAGFSKYMNDQIESAFNNLTPSEQAALGRLAPGMGIGTGTGSEDEKKDDKLAEKSGSNIKKVAAVDVNPNAGKGSQKSNDGAVWDFNFDDEAAAAKAEQDAIAAALAEQEDDNYQVDGDINDDRNKNLFNIITRRYLKSAYPVIFEEQ